MITNPATNLKVRDFLQFNRYRILYVTSSPNTNSRVTSVMDSRQDK